MFISLDNLATRYGLLPSEALDRANTLDFRVMEIATKWELRRQRLADPVEKAKVEAEDLQKQYSQNDLQQMIDNVNGEGNADS